MKKKTSPLGTIIVGLVVLITGIFTTANASSSFFSSSSFYPSVNAGNTLIAVIFLAALVFFAAKVFRMEEQGDNDGLGPVEDFSERLEQEEKPAPAPAPAPVAANAEKPREKKIVYCPYCGTAQKEDYMVCESCGAGRKK